MQTIAKLRRSSTGSSPVQLALKTLHLPSIYIDKKTTLFQPGEEQSFILVKNGLIKQCMYTPDKERTQNLFLQDNVVAHPTNFVTYNPSDHFFEAIAGTEIVFINQEIIAQFERSIPFFKAKLIRHIKEQEARKLRDGNFLLLLALYKNFEN